jgi:hypothetical protein
MHPHTDPRNPLAPAAEAPGLDQQILRALESKPVSTIPADFAARIAAQAAAIPMRARIHPDPTRTPRYGLTAAWSSLIVLSIAIFLLSPASLTLHAPTPLLAVECVLLAQLLALALWLASPRFPGRV